MKLLRPLENSPEALPPPPLWGEPSAAASEPAMVHSSVMSAGVPKSSSSNSQGARMLRHAC